MRSLYGRGVVLAVFGWPRSSAESRNSATIPELSLLRRPAPSICCRGYVLPDRNLTLWCAGRSTKFPALSWSRPRLCRFPVHRNTGFRLLLPACKTASLCGLHTSLQVLQKSWPSQHAGNCWTQCCVAGFYIPSLNVQLPWLYEGSRPLHTYCGV